MRNKYHIFSPTSFATGLLVGILVLGVCADSDTRTAFAHGIINAFGIEYDNSSSGLVAADVQAAVDENAGTYAALEARITTLESNPCDPNGDGAITAKEMFDYIESQGNPGIPLGDVQQAIPLVERNVNSPILNGLLDTPAEINEWNRFLMIPSGISTCKAD